ncbi:MAG: flagellar motor switch protein FliN [Bacteroidota bacterium]
MSVSLSMQDLLGAVRTVLSSLLGREVQLTAQPTEAPDDVAAERHKLTASSEAGELLFTVALDAGWVPALSEALPGEAPAETDDLLLDLASRIYSGLLDQAKTAGLAVPEAVFAVAASAPALPTPGQAVAFEWAQDDASLAGYLLFPDRAASPPPPGPAAEAIPGIARPSFEDLGSERLGGGEAGNLDMLSDVELEVTVELGRRRLPLADVLRLTTGSIVELDKLVGQPLDIYANGRLVAEGEAVVIDEQFGVRVTSLAARQRQQKTLF